MDIHIMKLFASIVLVTLWSLTSAAPLNNPDLPGILKYVYDKNEDGSYSFEYETADGTKRQESGQFYTDEGQAEPIYRVFGSFSYKGPDEVTYSVNYRADEYGFQPLGAHLPGKRPSKFKSVTPGVLASLLG